MSEKEEFGADEFEQAQTLYRSVQRYLARHFSPPKDPTEEKLIEEIRDLLLKLKMAHSWRRARSVVRLSTLIDLKVVALFQRRMGRLDD